MGIPGERRTKPGPRIWVFVVGPISIAVGLVLAIIAFVISVALAGNPRELGYCSAEGDIGSYRTVIPRKTIVYLNEGWSGLPPRDSCSVYLVDYTYANPPLSAEEAIRRSPPPHRLVAHGSIPGTEAYVWIIGLLVLPTAIWATLALGTGIKRRREWSWYS